MISTTNEWDQLKSIIVGLAWGANKPKTCHFERPGPYPSIITAQADADLNNLVEVLKHEGVKVYRPQRHSFVPNGILFTDGLNAQMTNSGMDSITVTYIGEG